MSAIMNGYSGFNRTTVECKWGPLSSQGQISCEVLIELQ